MLKKSSQRDDGGAGRHAINCESLILYKRLPVTTIPLIFWLRLTAFGDILVTLPAAAAIVLWLLSGQAWRLATWWLVLFLGATGLVVLTKIAFIGWGIGIRSWDFTGISGHAMRAAAVMPVIGYLGFHQARLKFQSVGIWLGIVIALMISVSRVVVHAHSVSEAAIGALLGTAVSLVFIRIARTADKPVVNRWLITATLAGLFLMAAGEPAPTQKMLTKVALALSGHQRPFTRADWDAPAQIGPAAGVIEKPCTNCPAASDQPILYSMLR